MIPNTRKNEKGFVHIFVIFGIVVLIASGGWWAWKNKLLNRLAIQNRTISTEGWKTYRNGELGIEFKYPDQLKVNYEPGSSTAMVVDMDYTGQPQPPSKHVSISITTKEHIDPEIHNLEFGETYKQFAGTPASGVLMDREYIREEDRIIDGLVSQVFTVKDNLSKEDSTTIHTSNRGKLYVIKLKGDKEEKELFAQILSTFKFVDSENNTDEMTEAKNALVEYFNLLNQGDYANAISLHGSGFDTLKTWNPGVNDEKTLLENGCEINGLVCLKIKSVLSKVKTGESEYTFTVQFSKKDGNLFVRPPCCGATEEEMSSKSEFDFVVKKEEGQFNVITQPVYVP